MHTEKCLATTGYFPVNVLSAVLRYRDEMTLPLLDNKRKYITYANGTKLTPYNNLAVAFSKLIANRNRHEKHDRFLFQEINLMITVPGSLQTG